VKPEPRQWRPGNRVHSDCRCPETRRRTSATDGHYCSDSDRALDVDRHRLAELVQRALIERSTAPGRGKPSDEVLTRAEREVTDLRRAGPAELMLTAHDRARFCE
jgi:hypothetical protein